MSLTSLAIRLTGPSAAAIGVVRLCGEEVQPFLKETFSRAAEIGVLRYGTLSDGGRIIDDVVVVLHSDGKRADLNVHGGPWVVRQVVELARRRGFTVMEAAEAPLEAFDGRSEVEKRATAAVGAATTWLGVRMLSMQHRAWKRRPRRHRLAVRRAMRDPTLRHLLHPPTVAILGPPNVGKSTLANQLFAQERSITADVPGTTRDWVGDVAVLRRLAVMLIDTPGQRSSSDLIEQRGIVNSAEPIRQADVRILVMDAATPDRVLAERFADALVVLNKADLAGNDQIPNTLRTIATKGEGVDALRQAIERRFIRAWRHATSLADVALR